MDWNRMTWKGMEWTGMEWDGKEWNGKERNTIESTVFVAVAALYSKLENISHFDELFSHNCYTLLQTLKYTI
jgi:hypothetical protein